MLLCISISPNKDIIQVAGEWADTPPKAIHKWDMTKEYVIWETEDS